MDTLHNTTATYDDFMRMPEGAPYQLINGRLIHTPSRTVRHQTILMNLIVEIKNHLLANDLGDRLVSYVDVKLSDNDVFQPDIVFISRERASIIHERVDGAP